MVKCGRKNNITKVDLTKKEKYGIIERTNMKNETFNWADAIFSILFIIAGFLMIGTAKSNWLIALGVLFIINGTVQSERNRRRND